MAQFRQSGLERGYFRNNGSDQFSVGVTSSSRSTTNQSKQSRSHRRFKSRKISVTAFILILSLIFFISVAAFFYISTDDNKETNSYDAQDNVLGNDTDFLTNVTRTERYKVLKFGHGSRTHGRDSRYWDRDDRRRDEDYSEDLVERANMSGSTNVQFPESVNDNEKKSSTENEKSINRKRGGLYNEAGRNELKIYEAQYEASLKSAGKLTNETKRSNHVPNDTNVRKHNEEADDDDDYDDEIDIHDSRMEDYFDNTSQDISDNSDVDKSHDVGAKGSLEFQHVVRKDQKNTGQAVEKDSLDLSGEAFMNLLHSNKLSDDSNNQAARSTSEKRPVPKKKPKQRKFSGACETKFLNSTAQLIEPLESQRFARFSLQYTEVEKYSNGLESWEPRFAGHQSLQQREESFVARDQKINCGFVKSPNRSQSTGFDLAEDDAKYISTCHIAVISCIFGNSDHLRRPMGKTVSRLSRKNVCFVMFVDEVTLQTLSSEGQMPDRTGFIGIWKIIVVKNLPYTDMRRVGKIPKLLPHRLFPSARYSIWLDSKLRLQLDPLLILEYFLWRKDFEYAISNHYDRHCVWDEVAQNKRLNKYNHTIIDQQFAFYQADGLKKFNPLNPYKLLPSNVPEGSFIVRAHTPMSNLFSCLWFNEVERFTPRDQLSFAYTFYKLRRKNPTQRFYLNMFKDCERRKIAKLFRHRSEESRDSKENEME